MDHTSQHKIGKGQRVRYQVTRGTCGKVRLDISKGAINALCLLVKNLT